MEDTILDINKKNNNTVFEYQDLINVENFLRPFDLYYFDHGGSSLCYLDHDPSDITDINSHLVYKICKKNSENTRSADNFLIYTNTLICLDLPILNINVIYEDEKYFVYTQPRCQRITKENLNIKTVIDILDILGKLLGNDILFTDLYYRNFGYYQNRCYLFDYCDGNKIDTANQNLHIYTLYHLFALFFNHSENLSMEKIIESKFGINLFPDCFSKLLLSLFEGNYNNLIFLDECKEYLGNLITKSYKQYQDVTITRNCDIVLGSHTAFKYNLSTKVMGLTMKSVLDAGGCIGGISLKLAQQYPSCQVTMNNITLNEVDVAKEIKEKLNIQNIVIDTTNITNIKKSYDVTLYFALVHHLLKNMTFKEVIDLIISQTNKCTIIEFPLKGDRLLHEVMKWANDTSTYDILQSRGSLEIELNKYFYVREVVKVDYGTDQLLRYAFICKLKN